MDVGVAQAIITTLGIVLGGAITGFFAWLKLTQQGKINLQKATAEADERERSYKAEAEERERLHKQELERQSSDMQAKSQAFFQSQYEKLNDVIIDLRAESKTLNRENDALLLTLQDTKERMTAAERGEQILEGQNKEQANQLKEARQQLEKAQEQLLKASEKVGEFNVVSTRVTTLERSLTALQLERERAREREAELIQTNNELTSTLDQERLDRDEERRDFERRFKVLAKQVKLLIQRVSDLETTDEKEQQAIKSDLLIIQEEINVEDSNEGEDVRVNPTADPIPGG